MNDSGRGLNARAAFPPLGQNSVTPWGADPAHEPSMSYVPYMVTGDLFHLEEMHFWATFNMASIPPESRGSGLGLVNGTQVRAQAWSLRSLGDAAYITP